ncbi:MAG: methyltransferase domain-containing protein [Pyrinomonadaceae bacterium]|nr:methyltransferase domain-containing protein [Pyrinomonadaceae bacterium]
MSKYDKQDRGNLSAYEEYFAGMDKSMQQKIALTTAHFPSHGKIADMGSGSGSGTFDLAKLYENLTLVGVDINPVTVEYSRNHYKLLNLSFETGDIADNVFPQESLDGILDSSVLHHVTSFNGFDVKQINRTISNQVAQLKQGGVLIIRDFVVPDEAEKLIYLDLPNNDGKEKGEIPELSTAALFEVFARNFRSSLNLDSGVHFEKADCPRENFLRFKVTLRTAAEFVLRKDYRDHWEPELLEEYTYCSQTDFEYLFKIHGLRIVVSMPLWNPWIVSNRFAGKFYLSDLEGNHVHFPPTNYLIVGEKIKQTEGNQILECGNADEEPNFLKLKAYRHKETNQVFELAERPNQTFDLLPWFEDSDGQLFVLAKKDFPRPIVNAQRQEKHLNRANYSGYLTEPITAIVKSEENYPQMNTDEHGFLENSASLRLCGEILRERANLAENEILSISKPTFCFPSPGGVDEQVQSFLVQIKPWEREPFEIENYSPFTSAGVVRELDALQVLRAAHVGGMFDARLETNIYRLLRELKRSAGSWIGAEIEPISQRLNIQIEKDFDLEKREVFEPCELKENKFLQLERAEFIEYDSTGDHLKRAEFEYVIPKNLSKNTVTAIPFFKADNEIFVGIEYRDLPAVQRFTGNSNLACVPAWRLPKTVSHKFDIEPFLQEKFANDFNVSINKLWELGGSFFTSAGITPEIIYPMAVELKAESLDETDLKFFNLKTLLEKIGQIQDAHLLISLNRLAHALGI